MDPLTHALAGQMIADALPFILGLGEKAPLVAALAAMSPDLDLLPAIIAKFPPSYVNGYIDFLDSGLARRFHRTYTHSFFFTTLASPLLGWLAWRWSGKRGRWAHWSLLVLLALYSHIVLDMVNPHGVRSWLPFSDHWAAWRLLPLFNPFLMGALAAGFILNHILRNSYSEPGKPAADPPAGRAGWAALANRLPGPVVIARLGLILAAARLIAAWLGLSPYS